MRPDSVVIVGGGLAAAKTAEHLRADGFDGPITLIGAEEHLPYERPALSKDYLAGKVDADSLAVHDAQWYADHDVDLRLGVAVVQIDRAEREVLLADGSRIGYGALVLATGSRSRHLDLPGAEAEGVLYLRDRGESEALKAALKDFTAMRAAEGANLKADVLGKLDTLEQFRLSIAEHAPSVPVRLREAMLKRLAEADLSVSADDERIIREVALFADKCDISEEITRLSSHFDQFRTLCGSSAPAGRPLDFLCQEIFREFNTIGSKANDSTLAHLVVAAKTELEKIREQVQNIE